MDQELRQYLEGMEQRLDAKMEVMEQRILDRTQEMVRDAQTEILRGFEHYQAGTQVRLRTLEAETSNLKTAQELRLANLEERVIVLEMDMHRRRLAGGGETRQP